MLPPVIVDVLLPTVRPLRMPPVLITLTPVGSVTVFAPAALNRRVSVERTAPELKLSFVVTVVLLPVAHVSFTYVGAPTLDAPVAPLSFRKSFVPKVPHPTVAVPTSP